MSPLDPATLAGALAPLGAATMLPAEAYTAPDVLAWERRHLFAGSWSCVGREADVRGELTTDSGTPRRVTQRAVRVGDVSVLLTWASPTGSDNSSGDDLRAFANVCRHRGHELLPDGDSSHRHSIICPYHAWSYGLDGGVRATRGLGSTSPDEAVRESAATAGRSPASEDLALVELPVERWGGWVFVHAAHALGDPDVPSFAEHLGAVAAIVMPYRTESLVRRARHTYEVAANWKVLTENYHECDHCPLIHPELCRVSPPDSGNNYDLPGAWVGGAMTLRDDAETMSITGRSAGRPLPGVDPRRVEYLGLLPDLLVSLHPDYVMTHRLVPLAPDRTWVECAWYFDGSDGEPEIDPSYAVEFWDLTNRQDWAACESVQRGLSSPHFRPGPLAADEDAVHQFVAMVAGAYLTGTFSTPQIQTA